MDRKKQEEQFRPQGERSDTSGSTGESRQNQMGTSGVGRGIEGSPDVVNIPSVTGISGQSADERNRSRQSGSQVDLSSVNKDRLGEGNLSGGNQAGGNPSAEQSQLNSQPGAGQQDLGSSRMEEPGAIDERNRRRQQGREGGFRPDQGGLDLPRH